MQKILEKTTYHAVYDESVMDALRFARTNGFAGVQLAMEVPHLSHERLSTSQRDAIGRYREEHNLRISLHPPDFSCSLVECSRVLTQGIQTYYQDLFDFAEDIGAKIVVLHLGALPTFSTDTQPSVAYPEQSRQFALESLNANLRRIINLADGRLTLAVENFQLTPDRMSLLGPLLGQQGLSLCWDLAKTYRKPATAGKGATAKPSSGAAVPNTKNLPTPALEIDPTIEKFFWSNLKHVKQVHLHDIRDGQGHRVIGSGQLDFMRFLPRLAAAAVMEYTIEVRPREKALESLQNLKKLLEPGHGA